MTTPRVRNRKIEQKVELVTAYFVETGASVVGPTDMAHYARTHGIATVSVASYSRMLRDLLHAGKLCAGVMPGSYQLPARQPAAVQIAALTAACDKLVKEVQDLANRVSELAKVNHVR